ncbi:MAG: hypothetical protein Q7R42_04220 [Candidatus Planktophila sp.]|nr:hypothetical protein [Candidatus Planktophila sp.]
MKKVFKITIGILVIIIVATSIYYLKEKPATNVEQPPIAVGKSVVGCYEVQLGKDLYSLAILSQAGKAFEGTLRFKNYQKDSSSGPYKGTYIDGILFGEYSFQSEGMDSVIQVLFKKSPDGFIRGYGEMNAAGDRFANLNNITYDSSAVFELSIQGCQSSQ